MTADQTRKTFDIKTNLINDLLEFSINDINVIQKIAKDVKEYKLDKVNNDNNNHNTTCKSVQVAVPINTLDEKKQADLKREEEKKQADLKREEEQKKAKEDNLKYQKESFIYVVNFLRNFSQKSIDNEKKNEKKLEEVRFMIIMQELITSLNLVNSMLESASSLAISTLPDEIQKDENLVKSFNEMLPLFRQYLELSTHRFGQIDDYANTMLSKKLSNSNNNNNN
jgi:hypothetical protein